MSKPRIQEDWEMVVGKNIPFPDLNILCWEDFMAICSMINWVYRDKKLHTVVQGTGNDNVCAVYFYAPNYSMVLYKTANGRFGFSDDPNNLNVRRVPDLRNYMK